MKHKGQRGTRKQISTLAQFKKQRTSLDGSMARDFLTPSPNIIGFCTIFLYFCSYTALWNIFSFKNPPSQISLLQHLNSTVKIFLHMVIVIFPCTTKQSNIFNYASNTNPTLIYTTRRQKSHFNFFPKLIVCTVHSSKTYNLINGI